MGFSFWHLSGKFLKKLYANECLEMSPIIMTFIHLQIAWSKKSGLARGKKVGS